MAFCLGFSELICKLADTMLSHLNASAVTEKKPGCTTCHRVNVPDSKVHGATMGPIWGWQDPGGPHVGPMNFAIWVLPWLNAWKPQEPSPPELACPTNDIKVTQQNLICQKNQQTLAAHLSPALNSRTWLNSRGTNKVATCRHFQKCFLEWKYWNLYSNFTEVYSQGEIRQNWFRLWLGDMIGDKPLYKNQSWPMYMS